jgi:divalent metal cation (Fe/Co/Zn/Cd) transporter
MSGIIGLLPWGKLPIFLWGAILALAGGILLIYSTDSLLSWGRLKAVAMLLIGVTAIVYDIVKRYKRLKQKKTENEMNNS